MARAFLLFFLLFVLPFSVSCIAILQFSYVAICCMCPLFTLGIHLHLFRPPALATRPVPFRFHFRNGGYRPLFEVFKQIRERDALFQFAFEGVFHQFPYQAPAFEPLAKLPRDSNAAYSLYPFFRISSRLHQSGVTGVATPVPPKGFLMRERDAPDQRAIEGAYHQAPYQAPAFEPSAKEPRDSNAVTPAPARGL